MPLDIENLDLLSKLHETEDTHASKTDVTLEDTSAGKNLKVEPKVEIKTAGVEKIDEPEVEEEEIEPIKVEKKEIKKEDKPELVVEDESGLVESLLKRHEFELPEGEEFTEDEAGLDKVLDFISDTKAIDKIEEFFSDYPEVKEFRDFVVLGGKPGDYLQTKYPDVDYSKLDIKDEAIQKAVVSLYYKNEGLDDEKVNKKIEKWEAAGLLEDESGEILEKLQKKQAIEQKEIVAKQKEVANKRQEEISKYWGTVSKTLKDSNTIKGLNIPIKDKESLFNYMAKPVNKNGYSQEMLDDNAMDTETKIALAYIKKNKLDLSKLIKAEAVTVKAKEKLAFKSAAISNKGLQGKISQQLADIDLHSKLLEYEK